jgi:methionyl-tRNA formyltransferase
MSLDSPAAIRGRIAAARAPNDRDREEVAPSLRLGPSSPWSTLARWAGERQVQVARHGKLSAAACLEDLLRFAPDLAILLGADIVPADLVRVPKLGMINAHFGLLPKYRGVNVAEWSIYQDDPVGVSVHLVDPGIDTGDIVLRMSVPVRQGETLAQIRSTQRSIATDLLCAAVDAIALGTANPVTQRVEEGRQYYRMHPVLVQRVVRRLERGDYRWLT